jgi:hypothetical protein
MTTMLEAAVATHLALRDQLKAEYALDDDDQTLIDTLDGISDLKELIAYAARQARYEEAQAEACKALIAEMQARKKRREEKAEKLRAAIIVAMEAAGERKIDAPDLTISVRAGKPKLVINGEADIGSPERYVRVKEVYSWDRDAIAIGLDQFDQDAMALSHWANPEPVLTLRGK